MTPKIRFEGFVDDWEQRKLSDLADIIGGGTPDTNNPAYWDGDIDWYAPAEMEGQRYATSSVRKITELGLQKSSAKMLPAHRTVLFTSRAGIGKMAILQHPAATNQGFQSLVLKEGTDPYFIYAFGDRIKEMAEGVASGSTFVEISGRMLGNLEIMVPMLAEQKEVASFFRGIDDLITLHQRKCDTLEKTKQYFLQNMFPQKGEKAPKIRLEGFTDEWKSWTLGELYTERNERGNDSLQILSVSIHSGISDEQLDEEELGKTVRRSEDKSTYKHVYPGDLIFNMMRAWQGAIGTTKSEGMISPAYISAIPSADVYPMFMNYLLRRKEAIGKINNLSYGVTDFRKRLYWDSFVKVQCMLPSVDEQKAIADFFQGLDGRITLQQRKITALKSLKKFFLQNMFPEREV